MLNTTYQITFTKILKNHKYFSCSISRFLVFFFKLKFFNCYSWLWSFKLFFFLLIIIFKMCSKPKRFGISYSSFSKSYFIHFFLFLIFNIKLSEKMVLKTKKNTQKPHPLPCLYQTENWKTSQTGCCYILKTCGTDLQKPGSESYTCGVLVHLFYSLFRLTPFVLELILSCWCIILMKA